MSMPPPPPANGQTNVGLAPNVAALLCYAPLCCLNVIFAIVVAIVEKQSQFLRFHAFQSLLLNAVFIVLGIGLWVVGTGLAMAGAGIVSFLVMALQLLVGLAGLGIAIFLMIKAYNYEEYALPTIGEMARRWA